VSEIEEDIGSELRESASIASQLVSCQMLARDLMRRNRELEGELADMLESVRDAIEFFRTGRTTQGFAMVVSIGALLKGLVGEEEP
jgi:hypothetical protein